jgi:hypothetical protein
MHVFDISAQEKTLRFSFVHKNNSAIFSWWVDILSLSMAFQPLPVSRLRKQFAHVLERPIGMVKKLWKKEGGTGTQPPTMEAYTQAANKCISSATVFMERAGLFAEAKRGYELWQKEIELVRVRKEVIALKLVIPLLVEQASVCQIEYVSGGSYVSIPCSKPALAHCADCGSAICSDCRIWCCGESFCEACLGLPDNKFVRKEARSERAIPFCS